MKGFGYIYSAWTDTFGSPWRTKQNIEFYSLKVVYFPENCGGLSGLVGFAKNWDILQTKIDQSYDHMKMNFDYFEI